MSGLEKLAVADLKMRISILAGACVGILLLFVMPLLVPNPPGYLFPVFVAIPCLVAISTYAYLPSSEQ